MRQTYIKGKSFIDILIILVIFSLDRITKLIVISYEKNSFSNDMFSSKFLNIYLIWNEGIAFGLFSFNDKFTYNISYNTILKGNLKYNNYLLLIS